MFILFCSFIIIMLAMMLMAVGYFTANKTIKGSCGGLGNLGLKEDCPICGAEEKFSSYDKKTIDLLAKEIK